MVRHKILYISYDGMLEPLGQSQVLSYLLGLKNEYDITLISYEKPKDLSKDNDLQDLQVRLLAAGIRWHFLTYHSKPSVLATAYDVLRGWLLTVRLHFQQKFEVVHCRSDVATLIGWILKAVFKIKIIFDIRGFWADEKVDAGHWKRGSALYNLTKYVERYFYKNCDWVVSLTAAAISELQKQRINISHKSSVIPTCVNLEIFRASPKKNASKVVGYIGGTQLWYDFPKAVRFFADFHKTYADATFHIINRSEHEYITKILNEFKIPKDSYKLEASRHGDIPDKMKNMDLGVFFIKPLASKIASMPTKFAEFLACGIPVVTGSGIGDVDNLLLKSNVGRIFYDKFDIQSLDVLLSDKKTSERCRNLAEEYFSLNVGIKNISKIYKELMFHPSKPPIVKNS